MDLRRLQTFVTVAELGTVSKAAEKLRITQPALSRQLQELQADLQLKLFEKVGRRLLLTGEGEQVLADCRNLVSHSDSVRERIRTMHKGDRGVLRLAASPQMIENIFPKFLRSYAVRKPAVQLKIFESVVTDQLAMLEQGKIHLAINVMEVASPHFQRQFLPPLQVLAAWKPSLKLTRGSTIDVEGFGPHPLLLLNAGFATRKLFDGACRLASFEPNVYIESGVPSVVLALAEEGHGIAVVPSTVRINARRLRVARVAYRQRPLQSPLVILWDKRRLLPNYAEDFLQAFTSYVRQVLPLSAP